MSVTSPTVQMAAAPKPARRHILLQRLALIIIILVVWQALSATVPEYLLPGPLDTYAAFGRILRDGSIGVNLSHTVYRVTVGFVISTVIGVPLGIILGSSRALGEFFAPVMPIVNSVSSAIWALVAVVWFGRVGANYCLDSIYGDSSTKCIHNPATGREASLPHDVKPASKRKRAVIVGGGPAGLEAARVLGLRGHDVSLFEANDEFGGQVRLAALSPGRREMIGIIDWRVSECLRVGVSMSANKYVERGDVVALNPHLVIIATGGVPAENALAIGSEKLVSSTWDVIGGLAKLDGRVLVFDGHGGYPAMDAALVAAMNSHAVEFVTPDRTIAPDVGAMNYGR